MMATLPPLSPWHVRVGQAIRHHQLLNPGQSLLLSVSGGQDSLCLLQIMGDLAPRWQWQLFIVHCNHRWTEDETACAEFLQQWVGEFGIPFVLETAPTVVPVENQARQWRYQVLSHWAKHWECAAVLTGHTASDRAETFLFNLIRGSGARGLSSLDWQRPLDLRDPTSPRLVRPLLSLNRRETAQFCQEYHLPVWPDQTNQDLSHARNRMRQAVIPYLQAHFNPQVETSLNRTAAIVQTEHDLIEQWSKRLLEEVYRPDPPRLERRILAQQHLALQRQVIYQILWQIGSHSPSFEQVETLQHLLTRPRRSRIPPFPGGGWAEVVENWIFFRDFPRVLDSPASCLSKAAYDSASPLQ